jgi:hypothetical protein
MRRLLRSHAFAFAFAVLACAARPAGATPMLTLDIAGNGPACVASCIAPGDTVQVTVLGQGIPAGSDGRGLFGFGFRVTFDEFDLTASNLAADPQWTGLVSTDLGAGEVGITGNLFDPGGGGSSSGPSGDGVVLGSFDLELGLFAQGFYTLTLQAFSGPGDNVLFDGTELDGGSNPGFFTTGLVPEPGIAALGALALVLVPGRRARRA